MSTLLRGKKTVNMHAHTYINVVCRCLKVNSKQQIGQKRRKDKTYCPCKCVTERERQRDRKVNLKKKKCSFVL